MGFIGPCGSTGPALRSRARAMDSRRVHLRCKRRCKSEDARHDHRTGERIPPRPLVKGSQKNQTGIGNSIPSSKLSTNGVGHRFNGRQESRIVQLSLPDQKRHIDQVFRSGCPERSTECACGFSANFSLYPRLIRLLARGVRSRSRKSETFVLHCALRPDSTLCRT